ncbi:hypothetical protein J3A83DRAFT_4399051 [Scleroderma citrinum]
MAVLVQLPRTKRYRLALLPVVVWSTVTAGMTLDFSFGHLESAHNNQSLAIAMFAVTMRVITWALVNEPYVRFCVADNQNSKVNEPQSEPLSSHLDDIRRAMWNACDLCSNVRGLGWNWSKEMHVPHPMFKIESRRTFAVLSLIRFILYTTALRAVALIMAAITPDGSNGQTIFDPSLPPLLRYLHSSIITVVTSLSAWILVKLSYNFAAFVFILLFQQQPSQWPPVFDHPWFATSLSGFWGRNWHQFFREWFMALASRPLKPFLGPYSPIGAFILSGILHEVAVRGLDRGGDIFVFGYFVMQGIGVVLERFYKQVTGRLVGGIVGFLWTWIWLIVWGNFLVDAWVRNTSQARVHP